MPAALLAAALAAGMLVGAGVGARWQSGRQRDRFAAAVAHDLRTHLAQIRLLGESLQLGSHRTARERDQWLACMDQAMGETGVDPALRERLKQSFFQTADWMRNTP